MRIGVIGAGAIGGTIAALLARAGHEVSVTARGEHLAAIVENGLRLDGAWGRSTVHVEAAPTLTGTPELAFVCTKAQDSAAAVAENAEWLNGIPVAVVRNGLQELRSVQAIVPRAAVVGAIALYASSYLQPGRVTVTAPGPTFVGSDDPARVQTAKAVAEVLGEAMPTRWVANFTGAQWSKLIVNQVNAMPAITGLPAQDTLRDPVLGRIVAAGMREAVRIGLAGGVRFGSLQGLSHPLLRVFAVAPLTLCRALPLLMARRMGAVPNPGSTLQSIRRGQPTEIDFLNGAVVRAAEALGRDAPVNRALTELVHGVEADGRFLGRDEVASAVG